MYDKMPCGNTQAEIDQDQEVKFTIEQMEEHQAAIELLREQKKDFVIKLMTGANVEVKKFSGDISWINTYTLNDAIQDIPTESELWLVQVPYQISGSDITVFFGRIYEHDLEEAINLIVKGYLPTRIEKIVKSAVEALADEVFGDE